MYIKSTYVLNIFIAYHQDDQDMFEEVFQHLQDLNDMNRGYMINKVWYAGQDLSMEYRKQIRDYIDTADLILLLMSDNSIMSPYFLSGEIKYSLELHEKERSILVPIILNTCWWEDTAFKHLEVLPRAGLPIYDSTNVRNDLFDQVVAELDERLDLISDRKKDLEEAFRTKLNEAESIFKDWEKHGDRIRAACAMFEEALDLWREGFVPVRSAIEKKIEICYRELDFKHYATAAQDAYIEKDYQTAFYNCKDALDLRDDAIIRTLYEKLEKQLEEDKMRTLKKPFDLHLNKGHEYFLSLQWQKAEEEYHKALDFYEDGFSPKKHVIQHKIEICHREYILENSLREASLSYEKQDYGKVVDTLTQAIKDINHEAFEQIEHAIRLVGFLENAEAFQDQRTRKWGFYDASNGNVIIAPKYTAAYNFRENLAGVKKWDKWGFIDIEGNEIIPFVYDFAGNFRDGVAEVIQHNTIFYINHRGERVDVQKGDLI
ncbi:MAG: WG repeat-containing protein [Saprospiraceae bacterium]|nr:WG repeat-containing protein [Saprospiraceae bacterium]